MVPPATASPSSAASPEVNASASPAATASGADSALPTVPATAVATPRPTPLPPVSISLKPVVTGLSRPIGVSSAPGDPRLFVIQQGGQIVIVSGGKSIGTFLDISGRISCCSERGLLGLAFHPQYATNGRFFVRYTDPAGDLRVSEFHVGPNPNVADVSSEKILMTIPHPSYANHNGGRIEFGPDGFLYIGTGDGGSGGDPHGHGQSLSTWLGKMLRIDVDRPSGSPPYAIPPSNPFAGQPGRLGEIWSYGLRNPYSFSFDRLTGDLWIGDVGQDLWEEVDRATASDGRGHGLDFGWNVMEGNHCYNPSSGCSRSGLTLPLAEYAHGAGDSIGCAVIGGYVYRGTAHPELYGRYFFGDECSGHIWDLDAAGPAQQTPQLLLSSGVNIAGWGQDAGGELYLVSLGGSLVQLA
jgi:glucose/arabinose dehydrogenase